MTQLLSRTRGGVLAFMKKYHLCSVYLSFFFATMFYINLIQEVCFLFSRVKEKYLFDSLRRRRKFFTKTLTESAGIVSVSISFMFCFLSTRRSFTERSQNSDLLSQSFYSNERFLGSRKTVDLILVQSPALIKF